MCIRDRYKDNIAYCSAVIINSTFDLIASVNLKYKVEYPYIRSLLFLRESGPLLNTLRLLRNESDFDILLIDGHGIMHPRKCGLASYVGYSIDKPTIGVAKNLLCGSPRRDHFIEYDGTVLGLSLIHISEPTRLLSISYAVFCLK